MHKRFSKLYANKLTKIKTLAKKLYFQSEILDVTDTKCVNFGSNYSLTPQNTKPSYPSSIIVGNSLINTPAEIL